ncbi:MAG: dynamin family protein [Halioglobus sp.]|nr:dynamin family protein [Halioglobus sp.]
MKTSISEFCAQFSETLFPLAEALGDTVETLDSLGDLPAGGLAEGLANARHRLEALINKVQGQEAYVLLFGPLKSGKSTLINAISSGYVSEVTSLPAYPCMVYLKYGPKPAYSVVRYSGKREELESAEALHDLLAQSHRTLSDRSRAMDDFGEDFDPAVHLPSAIRRVFVELPVENLRESGTVLVDTPGLYSKMKFGYDYMTQEFRDSAACAVFIVKADNLFLEQVFSDFNDLLDQFSRVFVVVNIDTGKSDLRPDGSLEPSLESRDPDEVVRAFETLSMSAPLRRAADSGRLHIYPIDLRGAASRRLKGESEAQSDDRFESFLSDLMNYLNSNEYLREFIADTIRQAGKQCAGIRQLCAVEQLAPLTKDAADSLDAIGQRAAANGRLQNLDWQSVLEVGTRAADEARSRARARTLEAFPGAAEKLVRTWMTSDQSLTQLRTELAELIGERLQSHRQTAVGSFVQLRADSLEAATGQNEHEQDVRTTGLDVKGALDTASRHLSIPEAAEAAAPELEALPVHKTFADRLLFRSSAKVRHRVVPDPDQSIPAPVKEKRLADDALEYIRDTCTAQLEASLAQMENAQCQPAISDYLEAATVSINEALQQQQTELERQRADLETRRAALERATGQIEALAGVCAPVADDISALEAKHPFSEASQPEQAVEYRAEAAEKLH